MNAHFDYGGQYKGKIMISNHKIQVVIDEIYDISKTDLIVYTEKGKMVAATREPEHGMEKAVELFANDTKEVQALSGYFFYKIVVEEELKYVLLARSFSEESYIVGKMAVSQIRHLTLAYMEHFDRNNFIQNILLGNMLVVDMYNKAQKLHIEQAERVVYVIEIKGRKDSTVMETVKNLFVTKTRDFVTEIDEKSVILIKDCRDMKTEEELLELANMIVDNMHAEAMVKVRVGYGNRVYNLQDITKSYQEASMALEVGRIFYTEKEIISYSVLGIGRLIYQLPMSLCEMFIKEVFVDGIPDVFEEETMVTIQKFFENNLNISETARQLYVHRNTLVYRLERLEKIIGLDIRKFEDALTFKIALMVISHMESQNQENE